MKLQEIEALIKLIENSQKIKEFDIETEEGIKIYISKKDDSIDPKTLQALANVKAQSSVVQSPIIENQALSLNQESNNDEKLSSINSIKSPLVGTFYASPAPGANPFIKVGSMVKKGDIVCIIEAMKIMNKIKADKDGKVSKILVSDGEAVEYHQILIEFS